MKSSCIACALLFLIPHSRVLAITYEDIITAPTLQAEEFSTKVAVNLAFLRSKYALNSSGQVQKIPIGVEGSSGCKIILENIKAAPNIDSYKGKIDSVVKKNGMVALRLYPRFLSQVICRGPEYENNFDSLQKAMAGVITFLGPYNSSQTLRKASAVRMHAKRRVDMQRTQKASSLFFVKNTLKIELSPKDRYSHCWIAAGKEILPRIDVEDELFPVADPEVQFQSVWGNTVLRVEQKIRHQASGAILNGGCVSLNGAKSLLDSFHFHAGDFFSFRDTPNVDEFLSSQRSPWNFHAGIYFGAGMHSVGSPTVRDPNIISTGLYLAPAYAIYRNLSLGPYLEAGKAFQTTETSRVQNINVSGSSYLFGAALSVSSEPVYGLLAVSCAGGYAYLKNSSSNSIKLQKPIGVHAQLGVFLGERFSIDAQYVSVLYKTVAVIGPNSGLFATGRRQREFRLASSVHF